MAHIELNEVQDEEFNTPVLSFEDRLYEDLLSDCLNSVIGRGRGVSFSVEERLRSCHVNLRRRIASRVHKDHGFPLFIASVSKDLEIAEFLLSVCKVNVDQLRSIQFDNIGSLRYGTILFFETLDGDLPFIKLLVSHGADVNACSDLGMTPLQAMCIGFRHLDILSYLLENGGNVHINLSSDGSTCLMAAVADVRKCALLYEYGADVNARGPMNKTALHVAIERQCFSTTIFLLENEANPYLKNNMNDDALQTACIAVGLAEYQYLTVNYEYSLERQADALELLGARMFYLSFPVSTIEYWKEATSIREKSMMEGNPLPKKPGVFTQIMFQGVQEFSTMRELNEINPNQVDLLKVQSFIVIERILGIKHHVTLTEVVNEAEKLQQSGNYQGCINLWKKILEILLEQNYVYDHGTEIFIQGFLKFMFFTSDNLQTTNPEFFILIELFSLITQLLSKSISMYETNQLAEKATEECMQMVFGTVMVLLDVLIETANSEEKRQELYNQVRRMIHLNLRVLPRNDTILHCFVRAQNSISLEEHLPKMLKIGKLLLDCGANINFRNDKKRIPLHAAVSCHRKTDLIEPLIKLLLDHGAYLTTPDHLGKTPAFLLKDVQLQTIDLMKYTKLTLLAAQAVAKYGITSTHLIPPNCLQLIKDHS